MPDYKLQSAMEYLMTYGWAILIIAVVIGTLYQLGVFNSNPLGLSTSCLTSTGFLCQSPTLNSSGYLAVKFGQIGLGTITITGTACTNNITSPSTTQSVSTTLVSGQTSVLTFNCPLSSNSLGTNFKGYIWIIYNTQTQSGIVNRVAVVTSKVSTSGSSAAALGGNSITNSSPLYIYCIGGYNNPGGTYSQTYYTSISNSGVGIWSLGTGYPTAIRLHSCATSGGEIYCVGGYNGASDLSNVYYAAISSNGIGPWTSTTAYPSVIEQSSCVVNSGYIYCIAGYSGGGTNLVYYAPISGGGVGAWTATTSYPINVYSSSCVAYGGYVYCTGGYSGSAINSVYYAPLSSGGVGTWTATTGYPIAIDAHYCTASVGYIYCVGGNGAITNVYSAPLSSSGVGTWTSTTSYPLPILDTPAVAGNGDIYVIGGTGIGYSGVVYYAPISSGSVGAWTATNTYPLAPYSHTCNLYG